MCVYVIWQPRGRAAPQILPCLTKKRMSPLPTVTYFIDPHTGYAITKCIVVLLDPISGVLVIRKGLSRQLSGRLVQIGKPVDWDPDSSIPRLSNNFVRLAFQHDLSTRAEDVDVLRRELSRHVTMAPDDIAGQPYLLNHWGLAFPVQDKNPIVLRKEHASSLASLTLYRIFAPTGHKTMSYVMPHVVCVRPQNTWWTTVKETIREILLQHYPDVPDAALDNIEVQRIETGSGTTETVMRLSTAFPLALSR